MKPMQVCYPQYQVCLYIKSPPSTTKHWWINSVVDASIVTATRQFLAPSIDSQVCYLYTSALWCQCL